MKKCCEVFSVWLGLLVLLVVYLRYGYTTNVEKDEVELGAEIVAPGFYGGEPEVLEIGQQGEVQSPRGIDELQDAFKERSFRKRANVFYTKLSTGTAFDWEALRAFLDENQDLYVVAMFGFAQWDALWGMSSSERTVSFVLDRVTKYLVLKAALLKHDGFVAERVEIAGELLELSADLDSRGVTHFTANTVASAQTAFMEVVESLLLDPEISSGDIMQLQLYLESSKMSSIRSEAVLAYQRDHAAEMLEMRFDAFLVKAENAFDSEMLSAISLDVYEQFDSMFEMLEETEGMPWEEREAVLAPFLKYGKLAETDLYFVRGDAFAVEVAENMPEAFVTSMALSSLGVIYPSLEQRCAIVARQRNLMARLARIRAEADGVDVVRLESLVPHYLSSVPIDPRTGEAVSLFAETGM